MIWRTGSLIRPFVIYQPSVFNQKPTMMGLWFFTLLTVYTEDD